MQSFIRQSYLLNGGSKVLWNFRSQLVKRNFTNTKIVRAAQEETSNLGKSIQPTREPIGGFRGGLIGFLVGLTITGGAGYYYLLEDYHYASNQLLSSVEELQNSTNKVRDYAQKIEKVESELKSLQNCAATVDQIKELRSEVRQLYDSLNLQNIELKAYIYGLEKDVQALLKKVP